MLLEGHKPALDALHTVSDFLFSFNTALAPYNSSTIVPLALMAHI
jgi:hypothetical protein